jgi:hypothetical protein
MTARWVPRALPLAGVAGLDLSAREGFVLSRIDGATDVDRLGSVTGLDPAELAPILARLVREGAIESPPPLATRPPSPEVALSSATNEGPPAQSGITGDTTPLDSTHRQLFETRLHPRPEDERAAMATSAEDPELSALCFDPVPAVIHQILENPRVGLGHARLIAAHHRNPVGLDALAARAAFLIDREVQRLLLRNSQCSEPVVRRVLVSKPLPQIYVFCQSHDLPERHRTTARSVLRSQFSTASPDERVHLILTSEGRALGALSGLTIDGRTVALLCARTLTSPLLVENLASWPATPPVLIAHLLKQPLVRRSQALTLRLKRHPNCPRNTP